MKNLARNILHAVLPEQTYKNLLGAYHRTLAELGATLYRHPTRGMFVVAVTGTKGKSTVVEIIRAIFSEAGYKTAAAGTIRFSIGDDIRPNLFKMTMPGRFFLQKFLREAKDKGATHAVIEMTSEGAVQFRHKGIDLDALIFTNIAPEHIESHGSFEAYLDAKLSLARHLEESPKRPRYIVANADDEHGARFLAVNVEHKLPFSLKAVEPHTSDDAGSRFFFKGELWTTPLPGVFNLRNVLAALTLCDAIGVPREAMRRAIENLGTVAGRAERVNRGQPFTVVVDYAHTPDSLRALYETFGGDKTVGGRRICVLGATGGGRDKWKRPTMGKIVDEFCDIAILTDEDSYDEDPEQIVDEVADGFRKHNPQIILDRRKAIAEAFAIAKPGDVVLITGKGTDPYIMGPRGSKLEWSDKRVAQEELDKLAALRK